MNLANKIIELRKKKGISQRELAQIAGLSPTYISMVENGKKSPTLKSLEKISNALDIPFPILSFLALDPEVDIKPEKREAFKFIAPAIMSMVEEFFLLEES